MSSQHFMNNLWRWKCGLPENPEPKNTVKSTVDIEELRKSQWCDQFDKLRRNRMVMGTFRYGDYKDPRAKKFDRIGSAIFRLHKYKETGNTEFLVDVANLCMIEFDIPNHKNAHFHSVDDGEHVKQL